MFDSYDKLKVFEKKFVTMYIFLYKFFFVCDVSVYLIYVQIVMSAFTSGKCFVQCMQSSNVRTSWYVFPFFIYFLINILCNDKE